MIKCKRILAFLVLAAVLAGLTSCECKHNWESADCDSPKVCADCGATEGEALGHDWKDALCETPQTCARCDLTQGEPLGHTWTEATCVEGSVCSVCSKEGESAKGHAVEKIEGQEPSCEAEGVTEGERCSVCEAILKAQEKIEPKGHVLKDYLGKPATCEKEGYEDYSTCSNCSYSTYVPIEATGHKYAYGICSSCKQVDIGYVEDLNGFIELFNECYNYEIESVAYLLRYHQTYYNSYFNGYSDKLKKAHEGYNKLLTYCKKHSSMSEFKSNVQSVVIRLENLCEQSYSVESRLDYHARIGNYTESIISTLEKRIADLEEALPES